MFFSRIYVKLMVFFPDTVWDIILQKVHDLLWLEGQKQWVRLHYYAFRYGLKHSMDMIRCLKTRSSVFDTGINRCRRCKVWSPGSNTNITCFCSALSTTFYDNSTTQQLARLIQERRREGQKKRQKFEGFESLFSPKKNINCFEDVFRVGFNPNGSEFEILFNPIQTPEFDNNSITVEDVQRERNSLIP